MSILNPSMNKMIAELVAMPPQQLAQYAAANQNDTMKFLAAKAASDMQKKQQAAGAAQQQQAAAPPVADQVVQQMSQGLPEESGIGALPAPNMQKMAAGGIVAFAGGGETLDQARAQRDAIQQKLYTYGLRQRQQDPVGFQNALAELQAAQDATQAAEKNYASEMSGMGVNQLISKESPIGVSSDYQSGPQLRRAPAATTAVVPGIPYTGTGVPSASAAALRSGASTQARPAAGAAPQVDTGAARTGAPRAGAGTAPATTTDLQKLYEGMMPQGQVADPYAAQHEKVAKLRETQGKEELAGAEERKAGLAGLLAPKEQRIKDKEARLQKTDDNNVNMSLINAGLAMMQSTGKGLAGLAEGATAGVKQYSEGLKLSEAARQKIEDAKDAFDELKFNQTNMSQKEITAAKRTIAEGAIASENEAIAGIKEATGVKRADAKEVFGALKDQIIEKDRQRFQAGENALNRQVQRETANAPSGQLQLAKALGNGNVEAGMRKITEIAAGKFNMQEAYANYMKSMGPGGLGLGPQEFAAQIRALSPQVVDVGKQALLARPGG